MAAPAKAIRTPRDSDLPFSKGDEVIEVIRSRNGSLDKTRVHLIEENGDLVKTESGRWYSRHTGGRVPTNSQPYRAIHSLGYQRAVCSN